MSFVAIQQLQLEQDATPTKDKRSLKEIQEEEEFLKWWTAEEARLKAEEQSALEAIANQSKPHKSKNFKGKPKPKPKPGSNNGSPNKSRKGKVTATPQIDATR